MTIKSTISSGLAVEISSSLKALSGSACLLLALFTSSGAVAENASSELIKHASDKQPAKFVKSKSVVSEPAPSSIPSAASVKESQIEVKNPPSQQSSNKVVPAVESATKKTAVAASSPKSQELVKDKTSAAHDKSSISAEKPGAEKPAAAVGEKAAAGAKSNDRAVTPEKIEAGGAKSAANKTVSKDKHVVTTHFRGKPGAMLVPPPPPDTPTMIPTFGEESNGLMPMEYMSPELLKKRKQDLVAQLADAKTEAQKKVDEAESVKLKGTQFKTLFEEGVISKRELEAAEKDAREVDSSINRAQLRVSELQTLLDGVSGRINQINKKTTKSTTVKAVSLKSHKKR